MSKFHSKELKPISRTLRKNMTEEERRLWYVFLKNLPVTVHRQKVFGKYVLDFYCASAKTAIELDGSQHYYGKTKETDKERDLYLNKNGIKVLRYSNYEVNNSFQSVCDDIYKKLIAESNMKGKPE